MATHFAAIGNRRPSLPSGEYQVGDVITTKYDCVRITGRPHRQWYGLLFRSEAVYWPAEEVEFDSIPDNLKYPER